MKKVGIYNPYMNILGGGEKYILTIAKCLADSYEVNLFWKDPKILSLAMKKFDLDLSKLSVKPWNKSKIRRIKELSEYEYFFYVTDGSLFFAPSKRSFLIIQSPDKIPSNNLLLQLKLLSWHKVICYSEFMKNLIVPKISKSVEPLFVPIHDSLFQKGKKQKIILSVGRFFSNLHSKKQDILIETFRSITHKLPGWKLVLVGSVDPEAQSYFQSLVKKSQGLNVAFEVGITFDRLKILYQKSLIYWHAAGFGEDIELFPEKAEHFGVSTVEAMAAGCSVLVYKAGGQIEIANEGKNGFLWETQSELAKKTIQIISDSDKYHNIAIEARKRSHNYSGELFCSKLHEIIEV